jgi:hypothetical protein
LVNAGDIDALGEVDTDDFVEHEETPGLTPSKEGVLEQSRTYHAAFPDMRLQPEEVLVSGDRVVVQARITGAAPS